MANQQPINTSSTRIGSKTTALRTVRKIERPKPLLRLSNDLINKDICEHSDEVLQKIEFVIKHINNGNFDNIVIGAIRDMNIHLRTHGVQLETKFKDQLDRCFIALRNACREIRLDMASRLRLLEIIELRAAGWRYNENVINYYKNKYQECDQTPDVINNFCTSNQTIPLTPTNIPSNVLFPVNTNVPQVQLSSSLGPGEVIKCSGKFSKPTKIPGKNYFKDEIIIRNSDSGKVMGIKGRRVHMIEEFSDTVISFQRVSQGAKDRLVQITGPGEESINQAKAYIADTIRRNASPVRERADKERFGSDSSLTSSNDDDGTGGHSTAPFRGLMGRKGQQLAHSLSMNDASIGEYQYTVTVGRDTLKISGCHLDLVRTAKLVLEEHFANDIDKIPRSENFSTFVSTKSDKQLNDLYYAEDTNFGAGDDFVSMQSVVRSQVECNGFQVEYGTGFQRVSSCSSESEDTTFKENERPDENYGDSSDVPNAPKQVVTRRVTVIREPLFPTSPKEAFEEVENSSNMQVLCAKNRRAHFAKANEQLSEKTNDSSDSQSKNSTFEGSENIEIKPRITYTREFLLDCARSPYCRVTPKDMPHIVREVPYLLKKSPDIFDPIAYQKQDFTTHVFPVLRSSSTVMADFDDDDLV